MLPPFSPPLNSRKEARPCLPSAVPRLSEPLPPTIPERGELRELLDLGALDPESCELGPDPAERFLVRRLRCALPQRGELAPQDLALEARATRVLRADLGEPAQRELGARRIPRLRGAVRFVELRIGARDPLVELLRETRWMRALARQLAFVPGEEADDLVQEAVLAALERAPRTDRTLRPWLGRVLRNRLAFLRRSDARVAQLAPAVT